MEDNGDDAEKYDSLFEQLQSILACGPVCQERRIEDNLREKYNDAQINLLSGQSNLDDAEKNYILYTQGESAYDKLYEDRLKAEAEKNANDFKAIQEQRSKYIQQKMSSYEGLLLNYKNVTELYLKYKNENTDLVKNIKMNSNDILTSERKTYYQDQQSDILKYYYYYFIFTIYTICVFCFGIFSFIYPSQTDWKIRLATFIALLVLPFVSTWLLGLIVYIFHAIYEMLPKNVYKQDIDAVIDDYKNKSLQK